MTDLERVMSARFMAMDGNTSLEIAEALDMHRMAAMQIVAACAWHKAQIAEWTRRYGALDAERRE